MKCRAPAVLLWAAAAVAQQGDRGGETQTPLPDDIAVPPAVVRTPAEELATFAVAPGFEIDLVAAEPLVGDPVAAAFDAAGRLWVVEMRGFMNDVDGRDERAANGRIVVLHDEDHDGCMDRATVFRSGLVLPRAVLPLRGGALVVAPPHLLWCPDADGDLRADGAVELAGGFEAGLDNPEHAGNGLLWGLDHRIHLANDRRTWRWTPGGFELEVGAGGGQWGITHDDRGRLYFNYNEDWLRCDLVPGRYGPRTGDGGALPGLNWRVLEDRSVWPVRRTPGVNRGYQPGRLRDWVLAIHTAVCAPHVYRGSALPDCDGDVFVCEPAGHVVRRIRLEDVDGRMHGANPYQAERREFLASTDERFRPVHLVGGPDGWLYVVDMYRGVIQHRNFVTTFLRRQIERRALERPIGLGRIWRVRAAGAPVGAAASLHDVPLAALVAALGDAAGPRRDLALRELVQRREAAAPDAVRAALAAAPRPASRIALLSALAGLGALAATDVRAALRVADAGVATFALQHAGGFLAAGDGVLWAQVESALPAAPPAFAWQWAQTLGDVLRAGPAPRVRARALAALASLCWQRVDDDVLRGNALAAALVAADGWLPELMAQAPVAASPAAGDALRDLARRLVRTQQVEVQAAVFATAATAPDWQQVALLRGAVAALPKPPARHGWLRFPATPAGLLAIVQKGGEGMALANELLAAVALPDAAAAPVRARSVEELAQLQQGQKVFAAACAACHQPDGTGLAGLAPPLRAAEWVTGPADRLIRIVLHGVRGPIEVDGTTWTLEMPGQRHLADGDLAAVLSYVRDRFGDGAGPVDAAAVAALRAALVGRSEPWTAAELLAPR
jgi:mono/diheme cytochrome c family protein/glucose/arabinose dehydrogenase